jgi:hypothetical protein
MMEGSMKQMLLVVLLAMGALTGAAATSWGQGSIRLSWEYCDILIKTRGFQLPGVYNLVLSASGVDLANSGYEMTVLIGPRVFDAWRFDDGGCQAGQLTLTYAGPPECPALQGARPLGLHQYSYDSASGRARLQIFNTYDVVVPDPAARYTLWRASFDHTLSKIGPQIDGEACGSVEVPLTFELSGAQLLKADNSLIPFAVENGLVIWEGRNLPLPNAVGTPSEAAAISTTWGSIKSQYR